MGDGLRCGDPCPWPLFFCAHHAVLMQRTAAQELFRRAAAAVVASTVFTETGLPRLVCRDFEQWGQLANALTGLSLHGYLDEDELLTVLLASLLAMHSPWRQQIEGMPAKSRVFEILVARLYLEELAAPLIAMRERDPSRIESAPNVLWNQKVESTITSRGRQVDVVLEWYQGRMSHVFTAVECKDTEVEVGEVEAFALRLKTLGAHNGVMVSSVGFQSGAEETARAFNVELRVIREEDFSVETRSEVKYLFRFSPVAIVFQPPGEQPPIDLANPEKYSVRTASRTVGLVHFSNEIVSGALPSKGAWPPAIECPSPETTVVAPDGREFTSERLFVPLRLCQELEKVALVLPRRPQAFSVRDILSPRERLVQAGAVPLLPPPVMAAGRFYTNFFCQRYYCEASTDAEIAVVLLADRQHGTTLDVVGTQLPENAYHYHEIEDPKTLSILGAELERFRKQEREQASR
jgi:hypothetical protein